MDVQTEVWLVEEDATIREPIMKTLASAGHLVQAHSNSKSVLSSLSQQHCDCLVIDFCLPEVDGLTLWKTLRARGYNYPVVFISTCTDVSTVVSAMQLGAVDFLQKPINYNRLLASVKTGIERDRDNRKLEIMQAKVRGMIEALTSREKEVMHLVVGGMLTKQIARKLGISNKTVEVHRSNMSRKMNVRSVAQLVRLVTKYTPEVMQHFEASENKHTR